MVEWQGRKPGNMDMGVSQDAVRQVLSIEKTGIITHEGMFSPCTGNDDGC
jgi:hypothetical protein